MRTAPTTITTRAPKPLRDAFTFMEVLIVVTILAIVCTLLMPAIATVKDTARSTRCMSNQRQIAFAIFTYCTNFSGYSPSLCTPNATGNWTGNQRYDNTLFNEGILDSKERKILLCPGDFAKNATVSYGGNGQVGLPGQSDNGAPINAKGISQLRPLGNRLTIVQSPAACALTADAGNLGILGDGFAINFRHLAGNGGCYSFVDGHTKIVPKVLWNVSGSFGIYTVTASDDAAIPRGRY